MVDEEAATTNGIVYLSKSDLEQLRRQWYAGRDARTAELVAQRDWLGVLYLMDRRERPEWFLGQWAAHTFTPTELPELLLEVWSDCESSAQWARPFELVFQSIGFVTDAPSELPGGVIQVFRGQSARYRMGLSWTLDREKALWFARRGYLMGRAAQVLISGEIHSSAVYAYINGRTEREVVLSPRRVKNRRREVVRPE